MKNFEPGFADRLSTGAKARQAQLAKAKAKDPKSDPGFANRQAARRAAALEREARKAKRLAERKAAKEAEEIRKAKEEADAALALKVEEERKETHMCDGMS